MRDGDVGIENVALRAHDGEAHEHDTDASFDSHVGDDEEWFAEPPKLRMSVQSSCPQTPSSKYLECDWHVALGYDLGIVLSCAMMNASNAHGCKDRQTRLRTVSVL